ncbi:PREDICTED: olfactory receptor 56A1-like [Nanorana parkeri]|uniref:olfactory receptor 56A1-like n=1 Tax=Nanorana parkeri TaxID=125878 RepID=UPI000854476A|nr:PREDICTED: olfactory receptor 56A1-like [Nanorana parkeri]
MANSSVLQSNMFQLFLTNTTGNYIFFTLLFLTTVCLFFFMYFIAVMLSIFFTSPHLRENARYILFVYMLVNDMLYLLLGLTLMLGVIYFVYIPVPICYILYTASSMAFRVTPPTLAAMALEKYIAICHPLQYPVLCTPQKANVAFTIICTVQVIPYAAELCLMSSSFTNIFNINVICRKESLIVNPLQNVLRYLVLVLSFVSVAIVILFTYIKITMVAHRVSSQSSSATKARKTILLHAFQLLLCMTSLLSILTEGIPTSQFVHLTLFNFLAFTCVPRFLSPIIYGIRDEYLRKLLKKSLTRDLKL